MAIDLFRLSSRPGCSMLEIWDVEDPSNAANPPLCSVLLKNAKPYFTTVFQNSMYRVLKINWEQGYPSFCAKMSKLNTSSPATIKITSFPKRHFQRRYNYYQLLVTKDKLLHCLHQLWACQAYLITDLRHLIPHQQTFILEFWGNVYAK